MNRQPAVAGQFYPGTKASLEKELARCLKVAPSPKAALGAIAPHAGYIYSGGVAGAVFGAIDVPARCVVLSPNHTGLGARAAIWPRGTWSIPTGQVPVDEALAAKCLQRCDLMRADTMAHVQEHSLEVELPFLLARQPALSIVPITVGRLSAEECRTVGQAIADVVRAEGQRVLVVASTDMNHYEEDARTRAKDELAIAKVEALDADGLIATCAEHRISMCGVLPAAIAITACKALGAKRAELIAHATSGDVSGDRDAVVGYAGFIIE